MGSRRAPRLRTDATSTKITAGTDVSFQNDWLWTDSVDCNGYDAIAIFQKVTSIGTTTEMEMVIAWSDDGTTIPYDDDDNFQQSDYNIVNFTDGTFRPKDYMLRRTTGRGNLADGETYHKVYPVQAGHFRIGVRGPGTGRYWIRYQRLVM